MTGFTVVSIVVVVFSLVALGLALLLVLETSTSRLTDERSRSL